MTSFDAHRILASITDAFMALDTDWRFIYINDQAEHVVFKKRDDILGKTVWDVFPEIVGSTFERQYRRAVDEVVTVSFEEFFPPLNSWFEVRAYPSPDGLSIFFQNINERKRIQEALRASEDALKEAHERTLGILESITDAFFTLDSEFHFTYVNPQAERVLLKTRKELLGKYVWDVFRKGVGSTFDVQYRKAMSEHISVSFEEFYAPLDAWFEIRAYPSETGLSVFFQNVNVRKSLEMERDHIAEREHKIAQELQRALQPALPANVPGLAIGNFTRAALDEASIGGDFYDIFPLDKGLVACVIADVSGKGLAAAQQLALIRNSLRTTLYLYRSPSLAAKSLNSIVTTHNLLVGFVTAWVGVYDTATGQITFTSCGHEPGLLRRANGRVLALDSVDPPLGIAEHSTYTEYTITISKGDSILLYTDGLSESGPNRLELLGTAGLMRLFGEMSGDMDVQTEAEALVENVCAQANGGFRDDVAVLLIRRT